MVVFKEDCSYLWVPSKNTQAWKSSVKLMVFSKINLLKKGELPFPFCFQHCSFPSHPESPNHPEFLERKKSLRMK